MAPPQYGTQMWAVRDDFAGALADAMKRSQADDIDLWFIGKAPCDVSFTSHTLAGQGGHVSDCAREATGGAGAARSEYPVPDINFPELRLRRYSEWPGLREKLWGWHIGRHK